MRLIAGTRLEDRHDARALEERLATFLTAGLLAARGEHSGVKKAA